MSTPKASVARVPLLDHVVIMLDDGAYQELMQNDAVRGGAYGRFKIKTATSSLASTYTSAGLAGVSTLMEFFHVEAPPLPSLAGALVLSFPVPGSLEAARHRVEEIGVDPCYELVERTLTEGEAPRPWYHLMRPDLGAKGPFVLMLAEVTPAYFEQIGAAPGEHGELHREAYLAAAIGAPHREDHLLRDIDEVVIRLEPGRAATFGRVLEALGYQAADGGEGGCVYRGPEVAVRVTSSTAASEGITAVGNVLGRSPAASLDLRFGETAALGSDGGRTARWTFEPPVPHEPSQQSSQSPIDKPGKRS